jgi:hypothetical protein
VTRDKLYLEGELYLSLETVAEIYHVRAVWLREVFEFGLLGAGARGETTICIAAAQLDRVASIVRLHETLGLDLAAIDLALQSGPGSS